MFSLFKSSVACRLSETAATAGRLCSRLYRLLWTGRLLRLSACHWRFCALGAAVKRRRCHTGRPGLLSGRLFHRWFGLWSAQRCLWLRRLYRRFILRGQSVAWQRSAVGYRWPYRGMIAGRNTCVNRYSVVRTAGSTVHYLYAQSGHHQACGQTHTATDNHIHFVITEQVCN